MRHKYARMNKIKMDVQEVALDATLLSHVVKFFNCNPLFCATTDWLIHFSYNEQNKRNQLERLL